MIAALGITDVGALPAAAPPFDPATALDEASAWVASRSPDEIAQRERGDQAPDERARAFGAP
jgi:hypothetical protein